MSFNGWTPVNYERTYQGTVTVVAALAESLNVPTAYLGSLLGPSTIVGMAHEMGINEDIPAVLPISIGAAETTMLELTGAYQVFASGGVSRPPYALEAVYDAKGHLIYAARAARTRAHQSARRVSHHRRFGAGAQVGHRRWGNEDGAGFSGGREDRNHAGLP